AWRMDSILVTLQTMFAHSPERGGDTRTQRASKRTPGVRLSLRSEGLGMIQRTLILSLVCVGVTALAACGTPNATSVAPVAIAQSGGERSIQTVTTPPLTVTQNAVVLGAARGTTAHFACAVSVASFSAVYPYTITDWGTGTVVRGTGT